jgi:Asp-tRNA(Asn)/Glu-tRNA(Gln) amidotransferase A subunit family amidase
MKIGVLQKAFDGMRDAEKPVYTQALADLKKAGARLTPVDFDESLPAIRFLLEAEGAAAFDDITRDGQIRTLKGQTPGSWPNTFRSSRLVPAVEYIRAQRARTLVIERFEKFMADWDALVVPPSALLTTTNLTGNPQVVMKCGFVEDTLQDGSKIKFPRSIGFLGRIYDEGAPLRVALAYEQATEWRKMNPTLVA